MSETRDNSTPAAVLWDMDGTLIDSEPVWLEVEHAMLARYGIELSDDLREQLVGSGLLAAATTFQRLGVAMEPHEIVAEWTVDVAEGLRASEPQWRPGALELLADLSARGIPSALVTMSVRPIVDVVLEMLPEGAFAAVVAGDEVTREKPAPDPYLQGAAALGVPIADCVAIEDSRTGLRSAAASGAVAIGVPSIVDIREEACHEIWPTLDGVSAGEVAERFAELRRLQPVAGGHAAGVRA